MAYSYSLHEEAYAEYIIAHEWYEIKQKGLGTKFMNCVEKRLNQIRYRSVNVEIPLILLFMNFLKWINSYISQPFITVKEIRWKNLEEIKKAE